MSPIRGKLEGKNQTCNSGVIESVVLVSGKEVFWDTIKAGNQKMKQEWVWGKPNC